MAKKMATQAPKQTWDEINAGLWAQARKLAEEAWLRYMRGDTEPLYLYHRPSVPGVAGDVMVAREAAAGFELSEAAHIPRNMTADQLTIWANKVIRRLPILNPDRV